MTDKPLIGRDVGQSHVPIWEGNSLITMNYNLFTVFSFASSLRDVCALIRWFEGVALVLHFDLIWFSFSYTLFFLLLYTHYCIFFSRFFPPEIHIGSSEDYLNRFAMQRSPWTGWTSAWSSGESFYWEWFCLGGFEYHPKRMKVRTWFYIWNPVLVWISWNLDDTEITRQIIAIE